MLSPVQIIHYFQVLYLTNVEFYDNKCLLNSDAYFTFSLKSIIYFLIIHFTNTCIYYKPTALFAN